MTNDYVMTYRRFRVSCEYRIYSVQAGWKTGTKYACRKRMPTNCVKLEQPDSYVACREVNCPVLKKCEIVIV